jgi:hypothetical protein
MTTPCCMHSPLMGSERSSLRLTMPGCEASRRHGHLLVTNRGLLSRKRRPPLPHLPSFSRETFSGPLPSSPAAPIAGARARPPSSSPMTMARRQAPFHLCLGPLLTPSRAAPAQHLPSSPPRGNLAGTCHCPPRHPGLLPLPAVSHDARIWDCYGGRASAAF